MEYSIYDNNTAEGYNGEQYPIKAATDAEARRQARKEAIKQGIKNYGIRFFRASDGCHGRVDR